MFATAVQKYGGRFGLLSCLGCCDPIATTRHHQEIGFSLPAPRIVLSLCEVIHAKGGLSIILIASAAGQAAPECAQSQAAANRFCLAFHGSTRMQGRKGTGLGVEKGVEDFISG